MLYVQSVGVSGNFKHLGHNVVN